jgi:GNAT superfamily N-acetyltransferase
MFKGYTSAAGAILTLLPPIFPTSSMSAANSRVPWAMRGVTSSCTLKTITPNRLVLIAEDVQSSGFGSKIVENLEERLNDGTFAPRRVRRLLAGIYGENPGAVKFWERLGYHFAVDARPVLAWYAKELVPSNLEISR